MSFRELRNFCEVMRSLGYPRLISMENFRTPNFELVADILDWLLRRFDPTISIADDISTEAHRVAFIRDVTEKAVLRAGIKLNARKLYGADGYAVKELLKLSNVLYNAQKSITDTNNAGEMANDESFMLNSKLHDLKSTRSLCSQIVDTGATLFELLGKEAEIQPEREKALRFLDGISRNLESNTEHDAVERAVKTMLESHSRNLEQMKEMSDEFQKDEKSLEGKIKKKKQELERCKKRLSSLTSVRPAFMDEYEKMEMDLEKYYEQYVSRFRNLDYLEHELDLLNKEEQEKMEENERALKKMQKRLREEEWRLLRGEDEDKAKGEGGAKEGKEGGAKGLGGSKKGGGNKAGGNKAKSKQGRDGPAVFGSMEPGDDDDGSSEDDFRSESDPNDISIGGSNESEDLPISLGGSVSDGDIVDESDDEDASDDLGGAANRSMMVGKGKLSDHNF